MQSSRSPDAPARSPMAVQLWRAPSLPPVGGLVVPFNTRDESNMRINKTVSALVAGCALVVMSAVSVLAAQPPQEHHPAATDKAKPPSGMEAKCHAMMAEREKMMNFDPRAVKARPGEGIRADVQSSPWRFARTRSGRAP